MKTLVFMAIVAALVLALLCGEIGIDGGSLIVT